MDGKQWIINDWQGGSAARYRQPKEEAEETALRQGGALCGKGCFVLHLGRGGVGRGEA